MLNKPRGVVTTASDEKGPRDGVHNIEREFRQDVRPAVNRPWVAPVGRLDKASEGLLLLTNDSEWGARIAAPETHLDKTYHVQIGTVADEKFLQALILGVKAKDGERAASEASSPVCAQERKTAGSKLFSTKVRTARFAA